ncbi:MULTISPECIES: IclR family transcriptional regulator [Micrococcaceae]|jgi:DNA-binding IclR family transcriptional regulator|uniref:Transcriptional regulator, IclR family n=1 Tax=Paenarthrobacter aurescens (strain TC1) TaxID=290340 RepID=A1RAL1_PAEAT|nr:MULTISPECIES: IclR family transcriptional regulator [Micrococcaceae]ABM09877.1 putative transcriptional regulator, IclR family [Paenarthrobacter aurescens TC1]AFR30589.1 HTH-type transcriptional regulator KipR [Arthrobacter sp. Rue61a]MBP2268895.1 DNA-binding IclR family transcriptional regulator [Pseudarthrobacter sp. PvP004]
MTEATDPSGGMNLVTKSAAVLRAIAEAGELTVSELAERTAEPASSLYRLLSTLQAIGWVEDGSRRGKTRLGLDFVRLGAKLEAQLDLRDLARPELERLHAATGQTSFLCIRRGLRAVCIDRIDGLDVQIHNLRLGESMPLGQGAAPRAILAFEIPEVVQRYLRDLPEDELFGPVAHNAEELRRLLAETASAGVAVAHSDWGQGIGGVGAPIFNHTGAVVGALSISGQTHRVFHSDYDPVAMVQSAAATVSRALGAIQLPEAHLPAVESGAV